MQTVAQRVHNAIGSKLSTTDGSPQLVKIFDGVGTVHTIKNLYMNTTTRPTYGAKSETPGLADASDSAISLVKDYPNGRMV